MQYSILRREHLKLTIQTMDTDNQVNPIFQVFFLFLWWEIRYIRS